MKNQINIFIATGPGFEAACDTLVASIFENCSQPERLQIHLMEAWGEDREWRHWLGQCDPRDPDMVGKGWWVTPFSMFRYAIPFMQTEGFCIYFDADQIVLGDVVKLWEYREENKWAICANADGDCVMVMDCGASQGHAGYPQFDQLKGGAFDKRAMRRVSSKYMTPTIPEGWNRHSWDYEPGNAMLVHYTEIKTQPYHVFPHVEYEDHPNPAAIALWDEYRARGEAWQLKSA